MTHFATDTLTILFTLALVECFEIDPRLARIDQILEQSYIQRNHRDLEYPPIDPSTLNSKIRTKTSDLDDSDSDPKNTKHGFRPVKDRDNAVDRNIKESTCNDDIQYDSDYNGSNDYPSKEDYPLRKIKEPTGSNEIIFLPSVNYLPLVPVAVPGMLAPSIFNNFKLDEDFDASHQKSP